MQVMYGHQATGRRGVPGVRPTVLEMPISDEAVEWRKCPECRLRWPYPVDTGGDVCGNCRVAGVRKKLKDQREVNEVLRLANHRLRAEGRCSSVGRAAAL